ncbi:MAG: hypothetical protein MH472_03125 [Bacteroidia bacterium]|nr:hypothetical protein [Bacteroidia bacterium]
MNNDFQIADDFILPLFDEIFVVKERDFSIEYQPLGSGLQKLLLIVDSSTHDFLPENEMQLLQTIVDKGLRKKMEDVWVVNLQKFPQATIERMWDFFEPAQVIVWGCDAWLDSQRMSIPAHKQLYVHGAELLKANTLSSYITDAAAKGKLWVALQRMFFN